MRLTEGLISKVMSEMGRRGGKAGSSEDKRAAGKKSARSLTKAQRVARARKAGKASGKARRKTK